MSSSKKVATTSKPKLWVVKANDGVDTFKQTGDATDIRLSCDCTCINCKEIYSNYVDEKAMVKVLQEEIAEGDKARLSTIEQVVEIERLHHLQLKEKDDEIASLLKQLDKVTKTLEHERQLRLENVYQLEFQKKETARVEGELNDARRQWVEALAALPNVQTENKALKKQIESDRETIQKMNAELGSYNYELATLEDQNTRLRLRLNEADTKLGKVLRASSKNPNTVDPLPSLKSALRTSSSSASSLLPSRISRDGFTAGFADTVYTSPSTSYGASASTKPKQLRYNFS